MTEFEGFQPFVAPPAPVTTDDATKVDAYTRLRDAVALAERLERKRLEVAAAGAGIDARISSIAPAAGDVRRFSRDVTGIGETIHARRFPNGCARHCAACRARLERDHQDRIARLLGWLGVALYAASAAALWVGVAYAFGWIS